MSTPVEIDIAISAQSQIVAAIEAKLARQEDYRDSTDAYRRHHYDADVYAKLCFDCDMAEDALELLTDQYTGWSRYYHVTNVGGHIHTDMRCTSCFDTTRYGWRTDLSGLTPEQVVELEAYNACSVCMPIAPAEQREARKRYTKAQADIKRAERAAKAAEKLSKAAERARKLMVKVDAFYAANGGQEAVMALERTSFFKLQGGLPSTVGGVVWDDYFAANSEDRYRLHGSDPRETIAKAKSLTS